MKSAASDNATATNVKEKRPSFVKSTSCWRRFGIWAVPKRHSVPGPTPTLSAGIHENPILHLLRLKCVALTRFKNTLVLAQCKGKGLERKQKQEQLSN